MEGTQAIHLSIGLCEWIISVGNADPFFFRNPPKNASEKRHVYAEREQSCSLGSAKQRTGTMCPLVWSTMRSRQHNLGTLTPQGKLQQPKETAWTGGALLRYIQFFHGILIASLVLYNELDPHSLLLTHFIHKFSIFLPWGLLPSTVNSLIYCCKTMTELRVITRKISKKFHHSGVETVQITLLLQAETLDPIDKMNSFTLTSSDRAQCHQAVAYNEVHFFNHQPSQCIFRHQPSLINLPTQDRHTCWK